MTLPRILAIDDTPGNLFTLRGALADEYDLQFATSGEQGLRLAIESPPDLIVLDIMMPEMDGYEVCQRLKADTQTQGIPVIFITAMTESEDEANGLALGAADYITKPINVPIARSRIRNLLERERLRKEVELHRDQLAEQVKERTMGLAIAKEAAESAHRLKSTILTNISHEFRTPMTGVLGMVGIARRRTDDPKIKDYLLKAEHAANQLLATLTGLLDLALTESQRLTLEHTSFRAADIVSGALNDVASAVKTKSLALVCLDPPITQFATEWVTGDPHRIQQILHELLSNAIKFSEFGQIRVGAHVDKDAADKLWFQCSVSDEGIGIAHQDQEKIFEPFHQVDGSQTRRYSGSGIGLALCRQLARHMGGNMAVSSTLGRGATFTVRVPVEASTTADARPEQNQDPAEQIKRRHAGASVLIAEDDRSLQSLMQVILEPTGLMVFVVEDGAKAIETAKCAEFKLILMDLMMPNVSGIEAARAIRALPHHEWVPILAVTARAFEEDRDECIAAGINAHIPKPFARNLLLDSILEWLDYGQAHK